MGNKSIIKILVLCALICNSACTNKVNNTEVVQSKNNHHNNDSSRLLKHSFSTDSLHGFYHTQDGIRVGEYVIYKDDQLVEKGFYENDSLILIKCLYDSIGMPDKIKTYGFSHFDSSIVLNGVIEFSNARNINSTNSFFVFTVNCSQCSELGVNFENEQKFKMMFEGAKAVHGILGGDTVLIDNIGSLLDYNYLRVGFPRENHSYYRYFCTYKVDYINSLIDSLI